jgi:hypothetical protein
MVMQGEPMDDCRCSDCGAGRGDPTAVYEEFIAAVLRRDVDGALARMTNAYAGGLRAWRDESGFQAFFELWCDNYPRYVAIVDCVVDGDKAIIQIRSDSDNAPVYARVTLMRDHDVWRVSSERCADGRTRMPTRRVRRWSGT